MDRNNCRIPALTAERRYGSIDRLDEDALPVKLRRVSRELHSQVKRRREVQGTSSQLFASSRIQPSSITSAESLVTYTPCSSQVVAT